MQAVPFRASELRPGQIVARDVWESSNRAVVIRAGFVLTADVIEGLVRRGVKCVFIGNPATQGQEQAVTATREEVALEHSAQAVPRVADICEQLFGTYESSALGGQAAADIQRLRQKLSRTIDAVVQEITEKGIDLAVLLRAGDGPGRAYLDSATAAYLAALTALRMFQGNEGVARSVALAALMCDVALVSKRCTAKEDHPAASAEMMKELSLDNPMARAIVRNHHLNCDGSGFPRRMPDDRPPDARTQELSGIVRLASVFVSATADGRVLPIEALYELKTAGDRFWSAMYDRERLGGYLLGLSRSGRESDRVLCDNTTRQLRFAKDDFDRRFIRLDEYRRRLFEIVPQDYTAAIPAECPRLGERVLVDPHVLNAFLHVTPPFQLLDELVLSNGETGLVIGFNPERPCLPIVRVAREASGAEVPSGKMKIRVLSIITNERGHLRADRQAGRQVADCFYTL
jgi:hypothetical protein